MTALEAYEPRTLWELTDCFDLTGTVPACSPRGTQRVSSSRIEGTAQDVRSAPGTSSPPEPALGDRESCGVAGPGVG